jgi:hypothetical protein
MGQYVEMSGQQQSPLQIDRMLLFPWQQAQIAILSSLWKCAGDPDLISVWTSSPIPLVCGSPYWVAESGKLSANKTDKNPCYFGEGRSPPLWWRSYTLT